jgi:hypothetical protein
LLDSSILVESFLEGCFSEDGIMECLISLIELASLVYRFGFIVSKVFA